MNHVAPSRISYSGEPISTIYSFRAGLGREYPPNLNILLSGGKETNKDSLSNGE